MVADGDQILPPSTALLALAQYAVNGSFRPNQCCFQRFRMYSRM
jgi:hypothetical protein